MKTAIILFIIGILISATTMSQSDNVVTLTEKNTVTFSGEVNDISVANAQKELGQISAKLPAAAIIYLIIDSPGGSISAGNQFIDFVSALPQNIQPICIFCASMGYHMFQSFGNRLAIPSSTLMSHRASLGGLSGQIPGEFDSRLNWIKATVAEMDAKVAKRVGMSLEAYQKLIHDELWLTGTGAVNTKHADKLVKVKCDVALLTGTNSFTVNTLFGPVEVTTSKCPIITGILGVKFKKEAFRSETEVLTLVKKAKRSVLWNF